MIARWSISRAWAVSGPGPAPATRRHGPTRSCSTPGSTSPVTTGVTITSQATARSARPGRCRLGQVLAAGESARHDAVGSVMASPGAFGGADAERRTGSFDLACGEPDGHVWVTVSVMQCTWSASCVASSWQRHAGPPMPTATTSPYAHHRMTPATDLRPRHHRVPGWPADTDAAKSHVSRREFRSPAVPRLPGRRGPGSVVRCQPPRALTMFMMVTICGAPLTAYPGPGPV